MANTPAEDTIGAAFAAIERAKASGLNVKSTEAIHRRWYEESGIICEINDAGGFAFVRGVNGCTAEMVTFTPQETVALWDFWGLLAMANGLLELIKSRKQDEPGDNQRER